MWGALHDLAISLGGRLDLARRKASPEYASYRLGQRIDELKPDARPLIWLHGVSLGEVNALRGLLAEIQQQTNKQIAVAVSTMTATGLDAARNLGADHAFLYPLDTSRFARRIVEKLKPAALVIFDGDFWFQMMNMSHRAGVPIVIVNGKLSERTARRHGWFPSYARAMFSGVAIASVQSEVMAQRFARFIDPTKIVVDGNVKLDMPSNVPAPRDNSKIRIVFGSVHPAELDLIAEQITRLVRDRPNVQVIIAPRHPDKFTPAVMDRYFPNPGEQLVWVNKLGVLRQLYETADIAFVGGTFCEVGGHNLTEPALAGVPVIYGPDVHTQQPLHELLTSYNASLQVATPDALYAAMIALVDSPDRRRTMAANALRLRSDSAGLTARVAQRILEAAGLNMV